MATLTAELSATNRVVEALEKAGCAPRQRANGWDARCPAHEDSHPSLSVAAGNAGALLHCQAGCPTEAVVSALGLVMGDLFDRPRDGGDGPRIAATYGYLDEQGELLFEVVRFEPKDFRQRRPDGHGGWTWKLGDARRVPYRLSGLLAAVAAGEDVFVVEGEKDADAVVREGATATCVPGGAGKWRSGFANYFEGTQRVFVVADKDAPGYRHARDVLRSLRSVARELVVCVAREGKDASDHLARGFGLEDLAPITESELERLCEARAEAPSMPEGGDESAAGEQPEPRPNWLTPISWPDFWQTDGVGEDWLIEPIVARGRQTAIYSAAKTGKSLLALDIAAAAATGRSVLGHAPGDPLNVVYVDMEMTEADLRERLSDLGYGPDDDLSRLSYYQLPDLPGLDRDLGGEILVGTALANGASIVVIDTMARAVQGEENNADTYRAFYWHTGRRLKAAGISLLRLDHQGKDANLGQRGSSAKVDDVDVVFKLTALDAKTLKLTRTHSRVPWVPYEVTIVREAEPLHHVWTDDAVPAGTFDAITALDELEVPLDATAEAALAALRRADRGVRKAIVLAALKARRRPPR